MNRQRHAGLTLLTAQRRPARWALLLLFAGLFLVRIGYALSIELRTEDDVQVYLLAYAIPSFDEIP